MKKIIIILTIVFVGITWVVIVTGFVFSWNTPYYAREGAVVPESMPQIPEGSTEESLLASLNGTIEGSLNYPSEFIPPLEVCAENISTKEEFCSYERIGDEKYMYGIGYKLEVPEGDYQVFARLYQPEENMDEMIGYKAYYSEFVTCGLEYDCPSHNPNVVKVTSGETVSDIDPHDWYAGTDSDEPKV